MPISRAARMRTKFLISRPKLTLVITESRNPTAFFTSRNDLRITDGFTRHVLRRARVIEAGTKFDVAVYDFAIASLTYRKTEEILPEFHLFDENEVCAITAEMVVRQRNGYPSDLTETGEPNFLFTECSVVYQYWDRHVQVWEIGAHLRESYGACNRGARIFSLCK